MIFGSVCSGIEAASVAWAPLGWRAAWLSEIEPFPSAVLAHRVPHAPNLGDMTTLPDRIRTREVVAPELFAGGTPCQAFSVAGKRAGLADARGNLSMTFVEIADAIDDVRRAGGEPPSIVVWENVPGVLSSRDNAFGCFLGALAGSGCELQPPGKRWGDAGCVYGPGRAIAWRTLDAQYFGLAQRRRRVFVVASARAGFDPAAVLLEFDGVRRDSAPRREARESAAAGTLRSTDGGSDVDHARAGHLIGEPCAFSCKDHGADAGDISPTLRAMGHGDSHANAGGPVAVAFHPTQDPISSTDGTTHALGCGSSGGQASVAVAVTGDISHALNTANNGKGCSEDGTGRGVPTIAQAMTVRRLTPRECERLQGFPDDWTMIPWRGKPADLCPDGPRYKAIGNSWAVPVARWVGERIAAHLEHVAMSRKGI